MSENKLKVVRGEYGGAVAFVCGADVAGDAARVCRRLRGVAGTAGEDTPECGHRVRRCAERRAGIARGGRLCSAGLISRALPECGKRGGRHMPTSDCDRHQRGQRNCSGS